MMHRCERVRASIYCAAGLFGLLLLFPTARVPAWPLDDWDGTNIGRLEYMRRIERGEMKGTSQPPGALLGTGAVDIRLAGSDIGMPSPDTDFTARVRGLLGTEADRYAFAVLDLTDPATPRLAAHRMDQRWNPGSVGKLLVAIGWLQALADRYPQDLDARWRVLRDTPMVATEVIVRDSHTVRRWDRDNRTLIRRPLQVGDKGSLFEFLDWMVSPSSNAAASMLIRELLLFRAFEHDYPVDADVAGKYFGDTPRTTLAAALAEALQAPLMRNGFDTETLRQGSLFTRKGKALVPGTTSIASPRSLLEVLLAIEQGRLVDRFSSRVLKKLMYVTERRIRYASAPALREAAVYFKSGSLFRCVEEPGFECRAYQGNALNLMHSVAIVESPAKTRRLHYLVVVMSNILKRNSAVDHQAFGTALEQLLRTEHGLN